MKWTSSAIRSLEGIAPEVEKTRAIKDMPTPKDIHQLRVALGLFSYYRKFIPHFSTIASPLNGLLKGDVKWHWDETQETAFIELKQALCSEPVLRRVDTNKPYLLATDWSAHGLGAVLSQTDDDGTEYAVAFASRSCNNA